MFYTFWQKARAYYTLSISKGGEGGGGLWPRGLQVWQKGVAIILFLFLRDKNTYFFGVSTLKN